MPDSLDRLKSALADHCEIERELGHGAMATVYLARDVKLDRRALAKLPADRFSTAGEFAEALDLCRQGRTSLFDYLASPF